MLQNWKKHLNTCPSHPEQWKLPSRLSFHMLMLLTFKQFKRHRSMPSKFHMQHPISVTYFVKIPAVY